MTQAPTRPTVRPRPTLPYPGWSWWSEDLLPSEDAAQPAARRRPLRATLHVVEGVGVISLRGHLDRDGLPACRGALDGALGLRLPSLVIDLDRVRLGEGSLAVLDLMRRSAARHGMSVSLVVTPPRVRDVLVRAGVANRVAILPTVAIAVSLAAESRGTPPEPRGW